MDAWKIVRSEKFGCTFLMQGERQVCELSGISDPDDLDRMAACLNACEGIETNDLVADGATAVCESL